jgi:hypothetical protein
MTVRKRKLTAEETCAQVGDINARMAALQQRWETSAQNDLRALRGALIFLQAQLPPWVFSGVMKNLRVPQMQPPFHGIRWLVVREAFDALAVGDGPENAYKLASSLDFHGTELT